jgi:hypothetical protein
LARGMGLKTTTPYRVWFEGQQVMKRLRTLALPVHLAAD